MLRSVILGTGRAVPERTVTNAEFAAQIDTTDEWIRERTGIRERHWIRPGETGVELGKRASLAAMEMAGLSRLVFTSAIGVGDTFADAPLPAKLFFVTLLRGIYADKLVGDRLIRDSDLDWTIVQPSKMTDGPLTKQYRSGEHLVFAGKAEISRADTAHFILDRINDPSSIRKTLVVSY